MTKVDLSLVSENAANAANPPRKLGKYGRSLWDQILAQYRIEDRGGLELLAQACASLDRAESLSEAINTDGPTYYAKGIPKAHPALRDELACRAFVVRTLERLGVNTEAIKSVGRPAGGRSGWMETVR